MAYDLLRKFSKSLYEDQPDLQDTNSTVSSIDIKDLVTSVCHDYQNPRNLDKVSMAQEQVNRVKGVMNNNLQAMTKNIQDADVSSKLYFTLTSNTENSTYSPIKFEYRTWKTRARMLETMQTSL